MVVIGAAGHNYIDTLKSDLTKSLTITGTTSASGAIALTGLTNKPILSIKRNDAVGFCFNRGDTYGTCFDASMNVLANTAVSITVYYLDS